MGKEKGLIILKRCCYCKIKSSNKCEGYYVIKNSELVYCPAFVDKRSSIILDDNINPPHPIRKEKNK